jgi:hypothetical protein
VLLGDGDAAGVVDTVVLTGVLSTGSSRVSIPLSAGVSVALPAQATRNTDKNTNKTIVFFNIKLSIHFIFSLIPQFYQRNRGQILAQY